MKIGINAYEAVVGRFDTRVGSSEYCYQLLNFFAKNRRGHEFFLYLPIAPVDLPPEDKTWHYKILPQTKLWTIFGLTKYLLVNRPTLDVFFSPTHYAPLFNPGKLAISIMDLSYLYFPQLFAKKDLWQLKLWSAFSIKKAEKIFTISQSSKNDIIKEYPVRSDKIAITYPGIKTNLLKNMSDAPKPYILFVGTIQPRKNIIRLIEAFSLLKNKALKLIIVGKPGWQYEEIYAAPKKFNVEKRVEFREKVNDEELKKLYQNAQFFVLPSLYEGFGLPVLEAMSCGTPVIASNISSLPEAGGEAALYVDPQSVNDLTEKMEKVLSDKKLREEMIKKGYAQVKNFSWKKTAEKTLMELEKML